MCMGMCMGMRVCIHPWVCVWVCGGGGDHCYCIKPTRSSIDYQYCNGNYMVTYIHDIDIYI